MHEPDPMSLPAQAHAWAQALATVSARTAAELAPALGIDPDTLVDLGYEIEAPNPPEGVEHVAFVSAVDSPEITAIELAVDIDSAELSALFGPARELVTPPHGGAMMAFEGIPGLAVVARLALDRVQTLTFELDYEAYPAADQPGSMR